MQIDQARIRQLIPHAGQMCLLERVEAWSDTRIRCVTRSHRRADNPLRDAGDPLRDAGNPLRGAGDPLHGAGNPLHDAGRLRAICGVEYAAQAMALHGALLAPPHAKPRPGLLVGLREVECRAADLDSAGEELIVDAERVLGNDTQVIYAFEIRSQERLLLRGRATVVLGADIEPAAGPAGD